jgi:hypothetical protein
MTGWPRPELISALALAVSFLSLAVSFFMAWRTAAAEKPLAWVKLEPTGKPDCWLAMIHLRNRSKFDVRAASVSVPIKAVPVTRKQDFLIIEYSKGLTTAADGKRVILENFDNVERCLKVSFEHGKLARPEETGVFHVFLLRSSLSAAPLVKMTFCWETMKPRSRFKCVSLVGQIPHGTLNIHLSSA